MVKTNGEAESETEIRAICNQHAHLEGPLLPIFHAVQDKLGYVSNKAVRYIADELNLTRAEVYGALTFYHDFHREPQKTHELKVCKAEACQAVGGREVWAAASTAAESGRADIQLNEVYCLGNCACAPSVQLDGRTIGRVTPERVSSLFTSGSQPGAPS